MKVDIQIYDHPNMINPKTGKDPIHEWKGFSPRVAVDLVSKAPDGKTFYILDPLTGEILLTGETSFLKEIRKK